MVVPSALRVVRLKPGRKVRSPNSIISGLKFVVVVTFIFCLFSFKCAYKCAPSCKHAMCLCYENENALFYEGYNNTNTSTSKQYFLWKSFKCNLCPLAVLCAW